MNNNTKLNLNNSSTSNNKDNKILMILCGLFTGFVNGFFGGGGGMIAVPFMIYILKEPVKKAHATAIAIIAPITLFSAITYVTRISFEWGQVALATIGIVIGGVIGAKLLNKCSNIILTLMFAGLMIYAGVRMILK